VIPVWAPDSFPVNADELQVRDLLTMAPLLRGVSIVSTVINTTSLLVIGGDELFSTADADQ